MPGSFRFGAISPAGNDPRRGSQVCAAVVVERVNEELAERGKLNTDAVRRDLAVPSLAARVKAGIATDPKFLVPVLDVFFDGRELVLRGVTHTPKEHKRIEEAARALAGGAPIRCELHYRT